MNVTFKGLTELNVALASMGTITRQRIASKALRPAAVAVQEEANRRIHSRTGRARSFRVYVNPTNSKVTPGSRANFFSQHYRQVLVPSVNASRSRLQNIVRGAVEEGVRAALR